jgi:hypothetical protein
MARLAQLRMSPDEDTGEEFQRAYDDFCRDARKKRSSENTKARKQPAPGFDAVQVLSSLKYRGPSDAAPSVFRRH